MYAAAVVGRLAFGPAASYFTPDACSTSSSISRCVQQPLLVVHPPLGVQQAIMVGVTCLGGSEPLRGRSYHIRGRFQPAFLVSSSDMAAVVVGCTVTCGAAVTHRLCLQCRLAGHCLYMFNGGALGPPCHLLGCMRSTRFSRAGVYVARWGDCVVFSSQSLPLGGAPRGVSCP